MPDRIGCLDAEAAGDDETFGFAGFFALPMRYRPWGSAEAVDPCPVLLPPSATVVDAGPASGAMSDEEQALFAEAALTTMGPTRSFAPVVPLCGHGSTTVNNPYASSLDCGACGGDLRVGLPLQSLFDGERAYHEPMRLVVVVQAPLAPLETVVAANPVLRELFDGQWVNLASARTTVTTGRSAAWTAPGSDGSPPRTTAGRRLTMDETWGLTRMTKVEVVINGEDVAAVTGLLREVGARGFTAVSDVSGLGHSGHHQGRLPFNDRTVLTYLAVVLPAEGAGALIDGLRCPLRDRSGVILVSDTWVSRPGYFR